jgi:hypothetical protein
MFRLWAAVLVAILVGACDPSGSTAEGRVIDGWSIAMVSASCAIDPATDPSEDPCSVQRDQMLAIATERLDQRDPGHASVTRTVLYDLGPGSALGTSSPPTHAMVFYLTDGGVRAIGLVTFPPFPWHWMAVDYGSALPLRS